MEFLKLFSIIALIAAAPTVAPKQAVSAVKNIVDEPALDALQKLKVNPGVGDDALPAVAPKIPEPGFADDFGKEIAEESIAVEKKPLSNLNKALIAGGIFTGGAIVGGVGTEILD